MSVIIKTAIEESKKVLMEYWPLNAFIATNPLWALRDHNFFDAISTVRVDGLMSAAYYHKRYQEGQISSKNLCRTIEIIENRLLDEAQLNDWVVSSEKDDSILKPNLLFSETFDEYQFQKPVVWIREQLFALLRDYFGLMYYQKNNLLDFFYSQVVRQYSYINELRELATVEAITHLLKKLAIPETCVCDYLKAIYFHVYGWSSLMNWRNTHSQNPWIPGRDDCDIILLMWLTYEYIIAAEENREYPSIQSPLATYEYRQSLQVRYIWQTAFELNYLDYLDSMLCHKVDKKERCYDAQFIFCIDTRSEGFRRYIEAEGNYQTFGFAGFFGPIFKLNDNGNVSYQAPALVQASHTLTVKRQASRLSKLTQKTKKIINYAKKQLASPFALFEMLGFWFLPFMIFKTFQTDIQGNHRKQDIEIENTLPEEQQFQAAYNLLRSIGLVDNFSPFVLICAHQTDNVNNPFKSSLNCGACGGNSGVANAIVICDILNNGKIREQLKKVGIVIPGQTRFIPSCHHTVDDRLEILEGSVPMPLQQAINTAADHLRKEKLDDLPRMKKLSEREKDWSELIPELGLVNNAAIIIGPRALTQNENLNRRVFLHSYDYKLDHDASILTSILSAPAIVAHWISCQYYFSTVNPEIFGAGNKAIHNVLPGVGVLEGNLSDLKIGLPLQSTHFKLSAIHEPRRIVIAVCAPRATLDAAIKNSPEFEKLLNKQWIYLKHVEPNE